MSTKKVTKNQAIQALGQAVMLVIKLPKRNTGLSITRPTLLELETGHIGTVSEPHFKRR